MLDLVYLSFMVSAKNPVVVYHTDIERVIEEQQDYTDKIINARYMRASVTR
jgi:hypothetical protein